MIPRAAPTSSGFSHLSPRGRRALKIAIAALVGIPWIPLAAALYAWVHWWREAWEPPPIGRAHAGGPGAARGAGAASPAVPLRPP